MPWLTCYWRNGFVQFTERLNCQATIFSLLKVALSRLRARHIMRPDIDIEATPATKGINNVLSVRPKVAELTFQLYGRSLHPELFETFKTAKIERGGYAARVDITSAGHIVTWRYGGITLTEVAASAQHPLPQKRRLMSYKLKGERHDRVECRGGVTYQVSFQFRCIARCAR